MTAPVLALILLFLPSATAAQAIDETDPPQPDMRRVSVRLSGGSRWFRGGDVNTGVAAWTQSFESLLRNEVVGLQPGGGGDVAELRRGAELGMDVIVHLTPRVAIVGGVGRIESFSDGTIENAVVHGEFRSATRNSTNLRARAIPMRVGAQWSFPLGNRASLTVEGGAGLYFTDLSWSHHLDVSGRTSNWVSETHGQDLGLHGGVWVDVGLTDRLGLVVGVEGWHANSAGLDGFREGTFSYRAAVRDEGTLRLADLSDTTWVPPSFLVVGDGSWLDERYGPITGYRETHGDH